MRKILKAWGLVLGGAYFLTGCSLFDFVHDYENISAPPKEGGAGAQFPPRPSTIQPVVHVPLTQLQAAANKAVSEVLPINDSGRQPIARWEIEWPWPASGCIFCGNLDADWEYNAGLNGGITISGSENRFAIKVPARIDGKVGLNGEIAELLSLNGKRFRAAANLSFESGFTVDKEFCPKAKDTKIGYEWTDGPVFQIFGRSCALGLCVGPWDYNISRYLDPKIRSNIAKLERGLNDEIPCEPLRGELQKIWATRSFPITLPYEEKMYVNIRPLSLHIPDASVDSHNLSVMGRLDATVAVEGAPIEEQSIPLPPNSATDISPGKFSLAIPVSTKYYTLESLAKQQVIGRKFSADTPLGGIVIRPKKVKIYPSGDKLAIGVSFVLDYKYRVFNTSGTVWFAGSPESANNGKAIQIQDISVTRKFSNPIWTAASILLEGKVKEALADGFLIDLSEPMANAEKQLTDALQKAGEDNGFLLQARDVKIGVGRILTANEALQVEGLLDAVVEASLSTSSN